MSFLTLLNRLRQTVGSILGKDFVFVCLISFFFLFLAIPNLLWLSTDTLLWADWGRWWRRFQLLQKLRVWRWMRKWRDFVKLCWRNLQRYSGNSEIFLFMRFWLFFWLGPTLSRQNLIFMPRICFFSSRTLRGRKPNPQQTVQLQKLRGSRGGETSWGKGWASEILLNGKHILKSHLLGDLWWRNHQVGNGWTPKISDLLSRLFP